MSSLTNKTRSIRNKHFTTQNSLCFWCERVCILPCKKQQTKSDDMAVLYAVQANSITGVWDENSYVMACYSCEREKEWLGNKRYNAQERIERRIARGINRPPRMKKGYRKKLWNKQEGKCYWCLQMTKLPVDRQRRVKKDTATLDHLRPDKRDCGGNSIVIACYQCNSCRHNDLSWVPGCMAKKEEVKQ